MLSVPMSTYLVCFAVHQFKYEERFSSRGVPVSYLLYSYCLEKLELFLIRREYIWPVSEEMALSVSITMPEGKCYAILARLAQLACT